jgi:predicted DNA-binding protein
MSSETRLEALAEHYDSTDTAAELKDATTVNGPDAAPVSDRMTTFAVRLPLAVLERVREIAEQSNVTTSALIRRWIEAGIAEDGRDAGDRVVPVEALLELIGRAPREHIDR